MRFLSCLLMLALAIAGSAQAQIGDLIWEENFEDLDDWIIITGNGYWGWGNGELEYYSADNVDIAAIPGDPGNNALRITARQESGPGIVDQWGNPLDYTSGKVISKSELTERLYDQDYERDSNVIEVFIGRLRKKMDPDNTIKPIETLRGRGYRFALERGSTG